MSRLADADRRLHALAAVFASGTASALLDRLTPARRSELRLVVSVAGSRRRGDRLAALGAALRAESNVAIPSCSARERSAVAAAVRALDRPGPAGGANEPGSLVLGRLVKERRLGETDRVATPRPGCGPSSPREDPRFAGDALARSVKSTAGVALPFDLPRLSLGFACLTPAIRALGLRAAEEVSRAIASLTGSPVEVAGRALPSVPAARAHALGLRVELAALPGIATLEVEPRLGVALLDLLSGGPGRGFPATTLTPLERSALELAVLASLDAVCALPGIDERLAPRLARTTSEPASGLAVELSISLGGEAGRALLTLPTGAVRALAGRVQPGPAAATVLELSVRAGSAPLGRDELVALDPGDVVLLDGAPGELRAVAAGGLCLSGVETEDGLSIEEVRMSDASSDCTLLLEVELARVPVTLGELARLEPGALLPLHVDRRGLVTLKVGDRTLGTGQLVDLEGAIGVRIDALTEVPR